MNNWHESDGIHLGVPEEDYHAVSIEQGVLSKSVLWKFGRNPYKFKFGPEKEETAAMSWGSMVDHALTSPDTLDEVYVVSPYKDFRSNEAKEWKANTEEAGKKIVSADDIEQARKASTCILRHNIAGQVMLCAELQASMVVSYEEPVSGEELRVKGRLDVLPDEGDAYADWIFDLKTIGSLSLVAKHTADFGYHVQAAIYLDVFNALSDTPRNRFGFIFQESAAPYEVAVFELEPDAIERGRQWAADAFARWVQCNKTNHWPSPYADRILPLSLPKWAE